MPWTFGNPPVTKSKFFVILAHGKTVAGAIATTSKVHKHKADPKFMAGCVLYKVGAVPCFNQETAIEPHNRFNIPYAQISAAHAAGTLKIHGACLPVDFDKHLKAAVDASILLNAREKQTLKSLAGL